MFAMENFNHSLPGIAQIGYCLCENIQPNIVLKHSSGIPVGVFTDIVPVRFFGQPSYEAVEEYDNNGRKVLCTLKFVSNDNIPLHKHLAFVITDASGTSFIIGSRERPYPVVKSSATSGNPSGESNATTYEIKWSSVGMPIRCAI
ncbi:MAG: hypothetical protein UHX00_09225 [Caryophanon sp.]|nr:hypothetical protein [Caryophanon sp.]